MPQLSAGEIITLATLIVGATVWFVRLEAAVKATKAEAAARAAELQRQIVEHYATKQELAAAQGRFEALAVSVMNVKEGMDRVERKLDMLVQARVLDGPGHAHG